MAKTYFIQIVLVIFFIFAASRVVLRWRLKELSAWSAAGWLVLWVAAGVVVVLPNSAAQVAKIVGIGRGADLVVYVSLAVLFFALFHITVRLEKINRNLTEMARREALRSASKSQDKIV